MAEGVAMQQRRVKKNDYTDPLTPVPNRNRPRRVRVGAYQKEVNSRLHVHFVVVVVFFILGGVFCSFLLISSNQKKANAVRTMAMAHSASRIVSSNKPFLIYGTAWKKEKTAQYVADAVRSGFRFIDTACQPKHYNEAGVGEGWTGAAQELGLHRSDFFLQTKFTAFSGQDPQNVPYDQSAAIEDQVKQALKVSLKNLRTSYLDSLVLHSPYHKMEDTLKVWETFESFVDEGKVLRLGISNCYDYEKFKSLYDKARIKPWAIQNRFHSETNFDTELRGFCKEKGIRYQSFWTLTANRRALELEEVKQAAKKQKLSPQTYMYAFLMSLGYVAPLSGTTNVRHMAEDVAVMKRIQDGEKIFRDETELRHMAKLLGMPGL